MIRYVRCAAAAAVFFLAPAIPHTSPASAQAPFEWPSKAKNLKVLPKDTSKDDLRATMVGFTRALGVRCSHCHLGREGDPLTTYDFASDQKPPKEAARGMVRMLRRIHSDLKKIKFAEDKRVNVTCFTCHHGRPRPMTLVEELSGVYEAAGIDSAVGRYQALRSAYYGRAAYDFGEESLIQLAGALVTQGRQEDAIRIALINVEHYPGSAGAHFALAEAYAAAGQSEPAIQSYRKSLELDPKNRRAEQKLRQFTDPPK